MMFPTLYPTKTAPFAIARFVPPATDGGKERRGVSVWFRCLWEGKGGRGRTVGSDEREEEYVGCSKALSDQGRSTNVRLRSFVQGVKHQPKEQGGRAEEAGELTASRK